MPIQLRLDNNILPGGGANFFIDGYAISATLTPQDGLAAGGDTPAMSGFRVRTVGTLPANNMLPSLLFQQVGQHPMGTAAIVGDGRDYQLPNIRLLRIGSLVDRSSKTVVVDLQYDRNVLLANQFPGTLKNTRQDRLAQGQPGPDSTYSIRGQSPEFALGLRTHRSAVGNTSIYVTGYRNDLNSFMDLAVGLHDDIALNGQGQISFDVLLGNKQKIDVDQHNLSKLEILETQGILHRGLGSGRTGPDIAPELAVTHQDLLVRELQALDDEDAQAALLGQALETGHLRFNQGAYFDIEID